MVIFNASPWYPSSEIGEGGVRTKGLSFRGVNDELALKHVEGSECCLIHADNPLREKLGVYVNPNVRVAYKKDTYEKVNAGGGWLGRWDCVSGVWRIRVGWVREWSWGWVERGRVGRRVRAWVGEGRMGDGKEEMREEKGVECLINEMQVLYQSGWRHL